jgi:hypothetical protein
MKPQTKIKVTDYTEEELAFFLNPILKNPFKTKCIVCWFLFKNELRMKFAELIGVVKGICSKNNK